MFTLILYNLIIINKQPFLLLGINIIKKGKLLLGVFKHQKNLYYLQPTDSIIFTGICQMICDLTILSFFRLYNLNLFLVYRFNCVSLVCKLKPITLIL